jgi:aminotransferase
VTTRPRTSEKASRFTESVIREMTRLALAHDAVNLSQGFPDFPAPEAIKEAACDAVRADINQYAITWGAKPLRDAIAADFSRRYCVPVDPETHLTVCCGRNRTEIRVLAFPLARIANLCRSRSMGAQQEPR